jgi:hypothetical protein
MWKLFIDDIQVSNRGLRQTFSGCAAAHPASPARLLFQAGDELTAARSIPLLAVALDAHHDPGEPLLGWCEV